MEKFTKPFSLHTCMHGKSVSLTMRKGLCQNLARSKSSGDFVNEFPRIHNALCRRIRKPSEVAGHRAFFDYSERGFFQARGELRQVVRSVELRAFCERASPCENQRDRICRSLFAFQIFVVMFLDSAVARFVFEFAIWRNENARHHGKASARARNHVAHNVAVIIFARPQNSAFAFHHSRHGKGTIL